MDNDVFTKEALDDLIAKWHKYDKPQIGHMIVPPNVDTGELRKSFGTDIAIGETTIPVIVSQYADKIYFVEKTALKDLHVDLTPIAAAFERASDSLWGLRRAFTGFVSYTERIKAAPYHWQRFMHESLTAWGMRLDSKGLLDDPDTRWQYQQAVLSAPFRAVRRWWGRVK